MGACGTPRADDPDRVVVLGDSITALEQPSLSAAVPATRTLDYVFRFGIDIAGATALLRDDLATKGTPGVLVVNLGTNDALRGRRSATGPTPLDPVVGAARRVPCVVLTTVSQRLDDRTGGDVAARINTQIAALAARRPTRVVVVDWDGFLRSLQASEVGVFLQRDGIHETEAGARWLAEADLRAIDACGSGIPPVMPPG